MDFQYNLRNDRVHLAHPDEKPLVVAPETTVREVLHEMKQRRKSTALVVRDERLVGIFDERDALRFMVRRGPLDAPVETAMVTSVVTVRERDTIGAAIETMARGGIRRLPMVDEAGRPTGLVKVSGLLHYLVEYFSTLVYTLPPEPHAATRQREGA